MSYLLDTNAWIRYLNETSSPILKQMKGKEPGQILLCTPVLSELYYGAYRSRRQEANLALVTRLESQFEVLSFDADAARRCGQLRSVLAEEGTPIGPFDLMIASVALVNEATLVTHNTREFGRVQGLLLEDWETDST